ncbi:adenine phosphoribosyltransferase [Stackebrandtia albiflava]|uniref:Adenine phosphoribosyltransferase n=1 Tax=Stackebrandtia albiflava TaxID=406432 RepID=A0A562VCG4_9ACTN|nr:adenine phosphoribosyltransferase [Stackebrandtia albiflava]TWJ15569.1 adenine phosphoribosyltransferase [Stackebrandtia albiflava]
MELGDYIAAVPDFPVPGVAFKDITPLLAEPEAFRRSVDGLLELCRDWPVDRIAAFDARGFLWGAPMAYLRGVPLVPVRKTGRLPRATVGESYQGEYAPETVEIHDDAVTAGDSVLLVDDVIATGGAMRAGVRLVERLGGTVVGCVSVVRLTGLGAAEQLSGYRVASLREYRAPRG